VWRARTVVVDVALPLLVMIDGELRPGVRRVVVAVLPAALTCRVPGGTHE
jgi:diacylglycerol kinase family enzyme